MKKILLALIMAMTSFGMISCDKEEIVPASVNGPWDLVKLVEARGGDPIVGQDIGFTEKYEFFAGGGFAKTSTRIDTDTGQPIKALGKFTIIPNTSEEQLLNLRLVFETKPELIVNCNSTTEERLFINADYQLVNDSWLRCDGEIFIYERSASR